MGSEMTSYFFDYADAEFAGKSFNGPSLIATLSFLTAKQAASRETLESYSPWSIAVHLGYFKYFLARSLVGEEKAGPFPYDHDEDGFGKEGPVDEKSWRRLIEWLEKSHDRTSALIRGLDAEGLARIMPEWGIPYGQAIAWYLGHDTYHIAQIRNMGVKGLASLADREGGEAD